MKLEITPSRRGLIRTPNNEIQNNTSFNIKHKATLDAIKP